MKAIILAAGRGSRMGKSTDEKPKCMAKLFGKSLLEIELESIRKAGINNIAIVRGYKPELIKEEHVTYFDNENWSSTNMVKSLCCASQWLHEDECIVSYSDIIYGEEAINSISRQSGDIVVIYNVNWLDLWSKRFENPLDDLETFKVNQQSRIIEIGNKANTLDEIEGQYMGVLKFTPKGWKLIEDYLNNLPKEQSDKMDMTTLLSGIIKKGIEVYGVPYSGLWLEADNENDLLVYEKHYSITDC